MVWWNDCNINDTCQFGEPTAGGAEVLLAVCAVVILIIVMRNVLRNWDTR